ncbi:DUF7848 domain-containing protein [Streptomyces sp. NBC_01803]|uniref:DUF7848 domain-containing protein n=1 Tax=Streptomyces sp. NBC_01803 TaxID=2975946 RepID=UPI002DD9F8C4|nr:hypothetical protein [Streptomyces sp. NBC_01803]WSA44312.1 hypothetical protein OIE51_08900 [Streptomyces sp. NBC_01803]
MTRATYRFREYTIGPDTGADAEAVTHTMQCRVCEETGPTATDAGDGTAWAARHVKGNPGHLAYREHVTRPYRFTAGEWQ